MGTDASAAEGSELHVRLLGPVRVSRGGVDVPIPRSRKVRALLAFLALTSGPVSRTRLCDLLWHLPNDPRGELRWCLSKLRGLLDDERRRRVLARGRDLIWLDLSGCHVDAVEIDRIGDGALGGAPTARLVAALDLFGGDLLDGAQIDDSPEFSGWLAAQRQRYRAIHVGILAELTARSPAGSSETLRYLDAWLRLAPFDERAHAALLRALVAAGRVRDAEDHLAATIRSFEHEGLDGSALREALASAREATKEPRVVVVSTAGPPPEAALQTSDPRTSDPRASEGRPLRRRASVAVMPFVEVTEGPERRGAGVMVNGLTDDIITRLAKLRVLFVIARGTVYALQRRAIGPQEAARLLNVEYVVSGVLRRADRWISVSVELAESDGARIIWTDVFEGRLDDTFVVLDSIVERIVAGIAEEIETAECQRALLKPAASLDAWEAYHRGLWHMYRFNGPDNRRAERFFRDALRLDPTFARAHAGLSFTHFQNAFLDLTGDHDRQIDLALAAALESVGADGRDPAAHWAMGRALWLRGEERESFAELRRSVELSPNFALGHYTLGFVHSQMGDPRSAIAATNHSRELSPFDPLQFAMLASRALAHVRLGELEEAADWAVRATSRPNAHAHILAIAAECLALASRRDEAREFVARIRQRLPGYGVEDFLRAFRFPAETQKLLRRCAKSIGFDTGPGAARP